MKDLLTQTDHIETVSEFTRRLKRLLENSFGAVWLRGEISNLRRQASGHSYFSLKDSGSQVSAVLFRGDAARQTMELKDGLQVIAYGDISVYEPRGSYQIIVRHVQPDGLGKLQQEFEALKKKLAAEGLFDAERKQSLPVLPRTIGFITSPTGAAVRDFIRILQRREWKGRLIILPASVQGTGAGAEIIEQLRLAEQSRLFDLLVVGRGGGSLEDLWAFNEEPLVRAIAACPLPVISAVGHEIDFTLCDFAADVRAETPSAAAEIISSGFMDWHRRFSDASTGLVNLVAETLIDKERELREWKERLRLLSPQRLVETNYLKLDEIAGRLLMAARRALSDRRERLHDNRNRFYRLAPEERLRFLRYRLQTAEKSFAALPGRILQQSGERLRVQADRLHSLSPDAVLKRGFVIVKDAKGRPVSRKKGIAPGEQLANRFADGELQVRVIE